MVSKEVIAEVLANWDLQDEKVTDIVFPETGDISDTAQTSLYPQPSLRVKTSMRNYMRQIKR